MQYGFIGVGNMGGALAQAVCRRVDPARVAVSGRRAEKAQEAARWLGCRAAANEDIARECGMIFLGVKPQMMAEMLRPLQGIFAAREEKPLLVSMAAGLTLADIGAMAGGGLPVVRIMPNTACTVGEGMILYCAGEGVSAEQLRCLLDALDAAGILDELPESQIDAGSAVAGCGGAFADLFLEALADGGVYCGLPREKARLYAAQMLKGAAAMALTGTEHTGQSKDAVCSPGGTTIAGVRALERGGFRSCAMEAVIAAYTRTAELKK